MGGKAVLIVDNGEVIYGSHQYDIPVLLIDSASQLLDSQYLRLATTEELLSEISVELVASTMMNFADDVWQYAFTEVLPFIPSNFEFSVFNYDCFNMCGEERVADECLSEGKFCAYPPLTFMYESQKPNELLEASVLLKCASHQSF